MNFNKKYPGAIPGKVYENSMRLTPRENLDIEVGGEYRGCRKCKEPTRWVEVNFDAPVCSEECLQQMDADFRNAMRLELAKERIKMGRPPGSEL